jgi:hypothetical protein
MGWERRKGKLYYYRKQRGSGDRVRSIYVGGGLKAMEASLADGVPVPDEVVAQPGTQPRVANIRHIKKESSEPPAADFDELGRKKGSRFQPLSARLRELKRARQGR